MRNDPLLATTAFARLPDLWRWRLGFYYAPDGAESRTGIGPGNSGTGTISMGGGLVLDERGSAALHQPGYQGVDTHADGYWTYCPECIAGGSLDLSVDSGADHRNSWGGNAGLWNQLEGFETMPYSFSDVLASLLIVSGAFIAGMWVGRPIVDWLKAKILKELD